MMMRLILFVILSSSAVFGQALTADSTLNTSATDSVDIREIVREQIENAKLKQSAILVPAVTRENRIEQKTGQAKEEYKPQNSFYSAIPLQYKIFIAGSVLVLIVFAFRRGILVVKQKATRKLKNKIAMLREEKVIVKANSKLNGVRTQLMGGITILDASEKQISKVAKELKIAKGELLLASRLKLYEMGKM